MQVGFRYLKEEADFDQGKGIRSLHVPNKVKNIMWRACRKSMPTKTNLLRKTIIESPICDRYKQVPETTLHALWTCQELDVVWLDAELWELRRTNNFLDFKELLSWLIKKQLRLELFLSLLGQFGTNGT